jgi:hypothetical protein
MCFNSSTNWISQIVISNYEVCDRRTQIASSKNHLKRFYTKQNIRMTKDKSLMISDESVISKIYLIRGHKVMLDRDLAELYGVETKVLNQAVRRNIERFPADFMFQLSQEEFENWKSQFVTSNYGKMGLRKKPFAFTEAGVAMLSGVLHSEIAIRANIQIIRIFTKMRELLISKKDILLQLEKIEGRLTKHDFQIALIFQHLKKLLNPPNPPRPKVGFRRKDETD